MDRKDMTSRQLNRADAKGRNGRFRSLGSCELCGKPPRAVPTVWMPGGWTWSLCNRCHKAAVKIAPDDEGGSITEEQLATLKTWMDARKASFFSALDKER